MLAACAIGHLMNHMFTGALSPLLPLVRDELSLTLTEAGMLTSAVIVTMTCAHLVVGFLGDRGYRDILISTSVILAGIVMLMQSLTTSFLFLLGTQIALGLAVSGYHPSAFPAISAKFPKSARAKAIGFNAAGGLIGMAIIPFLGVALLVILGGWREPLRTLGLMGVAIFVPIYVLMKYADKQSKIDFSNGNNDEPKEYVGWNRNFFIVLVFLGLRGIPFRCTSLMMPIYLVDSYGYEPVWAGFLSAVMLAAGLVGEVLSAPISDKSGRRVPYMFVSALTMVPLFLMLNLSLDPVLLLIVLIGIGFSYFFGIPPGQAFETEVSPTERQGLAFGLIFSVGAMPGAISPIVFGWIGDNYGLVASILFLAVVSGLAAVAAFFMRDTPRSKAEPVTLAIQE